MKKGISSLFFFPLLLLVIHSTHAQQQYEKPRVLFVYDILDDETSFFINTFRDEFRTLPCSIDELSIEQSKVSDMSKYDLLVLYSRVMAFNMKSPVRNWVKAIKSFDKKKVALMVTAYRWFNETHFREMTKLLNARNANIVDAVSMATKDLSDEQKRAKVHDSLVKTVNK